MIAIVLASAALLAAALAPASGAQVARFAQLPICAPGSTNTQYCQVGPPVLTRPATIIGCRGAGASFHIPKVAITSVAGLTRIVVRLDGQIIKTVRQSAVKSYTLKGLTISTRGLKVGLHTVTITAVDTGGRTAKRTLHFAICKPRPKFTG